MNKCFANIYLEGEVNCHGKIFAVGFISENIASANIVLLSKVISYSH